MTTREQILQRIQVDENGCWIWQGGHDRGYGALRFRGRPCRAHRVFYELFVGVIPAGRHLHHTCEVRACCNPGHLVALRQREHMVEHGIAYTEEQMQEAMMVANLVGVRRASRLFNIPKRRFYWWGYGKAAA